MKKVILFSSTALLVVNILAGLILSAYEAFNIIATSVVILITTGLLYATTVIQLKDAFRVSLCIVFAFVGLVLFLLMLFSPHQIQDNWTVIVALALIIIEIIMLYLGHWASKKTNL
ncbi:MAG: hypothetical protein J6T22_00460 [Bacteroidales bacterium]|nr:hypothetical protein [Bacteroidales bacterium]